MAGFAINNPLARVGGQAGGGSGGGSTSGKTGLVPGRGELVDPTKVTGGPSQEAIRNTISGNATNLSQTQAGSQAIAPSSQFLQNLNTNVSGNVSQGLGAGANLRGAASSNLDALNTTGLLTDVSGITQAAQLEGQNQFDDFNAQIMSQLAATGGADSSASVARLADAAGRISSNIGIEGLRAGVGAQEAAFGRRAGAVDPALGESALNLQGFSDLGGLENAAIQNSINARQGAGALALGGAGLDQQGQIAGMQGQQSLLQSPMFAPGAEGFGGGFGGAGSPGAPQSTFPTGTTRGPQTGGNKQPSIVDFLAQLGAGSSFGTTGMNQAGLANLGAGQASPMMLAALTGGPQPTFGGFDTSGQGGFSGAEGGLVTGPNQPTDAIPAMLTGGEGVIPVGMTQQLLGAQTNEEVLMVGRNIQRMLVENAGGQELAHGGVVDSRPTFSEAIKKLLEQMGQFDPGQGSLNPVDNPELFGRAPMSMQAVPTSVQDERFPSELAQIAAGPEGATTPLQPAVVPSQAGPIAPMGDAAFSNPTQFGDSRNNQLEDAPKFTNEDLARVSAGPPEKLSLEEVQAQQLQDLQRQQQEAQNRLKFAESTKNNAVANLLGGSPLSVNYGELLQQAQVASQAFEDAGGVSQESDKILAEVVNQQQLANAQDLLSAHQLALEERKVVAQEQNAAANVQRADDPRRDAWRIMLSDKGEFTPEQKAQAEKLITGGQTADAQSQRLRDAIAIFKLDISAANKVKLLEQAGVISSVDANILGEDDINIESFISTGGIGGDSLEDQFFRAALAEAQAQ